MSKLRIERLAREVESLRNELENMRVRDNLEYVRPIVELSWRMLRYHLRGGGAAVVANPLVALSWT